MAAQRTEKEETTEYKVVPDTPLSLSSTAAGPPPRRFTTRSAAPAPARTQTRDFPGDDVAAPAPTEVRRCAGCRKKVGLTGFRCRCGDLFCSEHRYSDRHVCAFDYKAAGREAIAKENPVVKAAKIIRL